MSQAEHENLSALVDGELSHDQVRFMLRRMDANTSLRAAWNRYHVMGDSLRHEMHGLADADLADRIMRHIGATPGVRQRHAPHRWLRWSAGGAIAAGVAVAALVVIQPQMRGAPAQAPDTAATRQTLAASRPGTAPVAKPMSAPTVPRWLSASPAAAQLAQPAAANFSPGGRYIGLSEPLGYYSPERLAPYMTIPQVHGLGVRHDDAQPAWHHWWSPAQQPQQQPARQEWRLQAQ